MEAAEETKIEKRYLEGEIVIDWKTAFEAFEASPKQNDPRDPRWREWQFEWLRCHHACAFDRAPCTEKRRISRFSGFGDWLRSIA
jgi:hypothetical protein